MDYQKIYNQIIERAQNRKLEGYKEKHHIIPKCLGGTNDKENLVELTAREHFLCHWLLYRIYPNNKKLLYSFWLMSTRKGRKLTSSRAYQEAKVVFSESLKGKKQSKETCEKRSLAMKGKKRGPNVKISLAKKGKLPPVAGKKYSDESKEKQRQAKLGAFKQGKYILQYDLEGNFIREWSSVSEASKNVNVSISGLSCVLKGKQKTAGGYVWKYKS
jgi:hypothetical protein